MRKPDPGNLHSKGASASPCVRNCCLDDADICIGCGRSLDEIRNWSMLSDQERQQIREQAAQRVRLRRQQHYPF